MRAIVYGIILFVSCYFLANAIYAPTERILSLEKQEQYGDLVTKVNEAPRSFENRMELALAMLEAGDTKSARVQLSHAIAINPHETSALGPYARLSFDEGDFKSAYQAYNAYLSKNPNDKQAKVEYALAAVQVGSVTEAQKVFELLLKEDPNSFQSTLGYALSLFMGGRMEEAKVVLEKARTLAPDENGIRQIEVLEQKILQPSSIESFLATHPILGPKMTNLAKEGDIWKLEVENFPVEQMPEFAKQSLTTKVQALLEENESLQITSENSLLLEIKKP